MRASDFPKLHHPDPSGFWNLVRTGEKLPKVGDQILYVVDIRGTIQELHEQMLVRIAHGDPYRCGITRNKKPGDRVYEHEVMIDEILKLPIKVSPPKTKVGIVQSVEFDKVLQEWWISVEPSRGWPGFNTDPDHIVYWAPIPTPPDTYTARTDDDTDSFRSARTREMRIHDYLESRRYRTTTGGK